MTDVLGGVVYNQVPRSLISELAAASDGNMLSFSTLGVSSLLVAPLACSAAIPSPSSVKSDITLLYDNDLDGLSSSIASSSAMANATIPRSDKCFLAQ